MEREPVCSVGRAVAWLLALLFVTVAGYVFVALTVSGALPWWAVVGAVAVLADVLRRYGWRLRMQLLAIRVSLAPRHDGPEGHGSSF